MEPPPLTAFRWYGCALPVATTVMVALPGLAGLGVLGRRAGVVLRALEVDHVADLQAGFGVAGGLAAGAAACVRDAEALVDLGRDLAVAVVEVVARQLLFA